VWARSAFVVPPAWTQASSLPLKPTPHPHVPPNPPQPPRRLLLDPGSSLSAPIAPPSTAGQEDARQVDCPLELRGEADPNGFRRRGGGGEYAGRTAVGAATRCWDGAGCEMRRWGRARARAEAWIPRRHGWGAAARYGDGAWLRDAGMGRAAKCGGWGEGEGRGMDLAAPGMTPRVTAARDAGTGQARLQDAGTGRGEQWLSWWTPSLAS
jgi:hypothetical protein